jgi:hypothetical protein
MKTKALLIAVAIMIGAITVQAQDKMFDKFSKNNEISTVFISKALLSMSGNMNMGGANIKSLSNKLERMEIYSSENKNATALMKAEAGKISADKSFEVLMTVKDKADHITFYAKRNKGDTFKDLIMVINDPDECTIIRIVGTFTMEDIQGVMGNKK